MNNPERREACSEWCRPDWFAGAHTHAYPHLEGVTDNSSAHSRFVPPDALLLAIDNISRVKIVCAQKSEISKGRMPGEALWSTIKEFSAAIPAYSASPGSHAAHQT